MRYQTKGLGGRQYLQDLTPRSLEGFRERILTTEELRQLLGFETKFDVHAFLQAHDVPFYTLADLAHNRETSARLGL